MHCKSYSHFFSKKFQHICVSLDVNFNQSLTNDVVSFEQLGPVVLNIISLTSSLVVKVLTVLVSTISNSQVFLLKLSYSRFFSKNISVYAIFNDQSFNDMLTNDIVSFEKLAPDLNQTSLVCHSIQY